MDSVNETAWDATADSIWKGYNETTYSVGRLPMRRWS